MARDLPSLEEPEPGAECQDCGAPIHVVGFCAECDDRLARERRIESGNEYRHRAQVALDLQTVRERVRAYLGGKS